mgnify:FL=1
MIIEENLYKDIIHALPILCVDLLIKNSDGKHLLHLRDNEPLKNEWWVPGGRVHKEEKIHRAASRKCKEELGLVLTNWKIVGIYEDTYDKNSFETSTIFHGVSIVLAVLKDIDENEIILDEQSSKWTYRKKLPQRFLSNFIKLK